MLPSLVELNGQSREAFAETLRSLFEAAGRLADALYERRPFVSYEQLVDTAEHLTDAMDEQARIAVVNAHPRIGERTAVLRQTSALSAQEQGAEDPATDAALEHLNAEYEQRFGFRFVVFVNRRPRSAILELLKARMHNSREHELHTALSEMFRIARDRLQSLGAAGR